MSIEKPANERLNLYNRFRESLRSGDDSTFYDADDLIVIIDQAVDLQDEYTQIEAIMRGYRYFPDNEELTARRAFLYFDLNLEEGVNNVSQQLPTESPMALILSIRNIENPTEEPEKVTAILERILDLPGMLEDEEIIQLVDVASAAGGYQWLKDNEKRLRTKTDYLPTLLYEIFITSDLNNDYQYSLKLLEELTELQPFNIDFWNALAQTQADDSNVIDHEPDIQGALNSLEFALAIDSENPEALTLKASILIKLKRSEEAEKILRPLIEKNENLTSITARMYVCALMEIQEYEQAEKYIKKYAPMFPDTEEFAEMAIVLGFPDLDPVLDVYFSPQLGGDIDKINFRGELYFRSGQLDEAIKFFDYLFRHEYITDKGIGLLFTAYYCAGQYENCIALYDEMEAQNPDFLLSDMIITYLMSYLRLGKKTNAKRALKRVEKRLPMNMRETWTSKMSIEGIGMTNFIMAVKSLLEESGPINVELVDIFKYPYSHEE